MSDLEQKSADNLSAKKNDDDEISLLDLFAVLWRRRVMIPC
jgi:uncharacterized protein involved in exopolysaccharide biosynthesis